MNSPFLVPSDRQRSPWLVIGLLATTLWLGAGLLVDLVLMPSLYASGMMETNGFAAGGSLMFGTFNRAELVAAGLAAVSSLALKHTHVLNRSGRLAISLSLGLIAIALVQTYALTPQMIGLGAGLDWLSPQHAIGSGMDRLHGVYFVLEFLKLATLGILARLCWAQGWKNFGATDRSSSNL